MTFSKHLVDQGPPESELNTSPIFLDVDAEREVIDTAIPEERVCHFNGKSYEHGSYIKSESTILKCDRGAWIETETP